MSRIAIRAEGLGKEYQIGERAGYMPPLREVLGNALRSPAKLFKSNGNSEAHNDHRSRGRETIWALRDASFEIQEGEVVGLIGRNGAGKTTLLKILARITRPTVGFAEVHGRMGSLLEVGTGFHHELTGRENCYLSGAILGMSKREIERKFDEIVAFAEVEKFIDTPIKHYSTGMQMRLAFAIAAHLEPEILLVDEVLAVGDLAFQKKCLGKMEMVAKGGRTIVLVSHSMAAITRLCQRGMLLDGGKIILDTDAIEAARAYSTSDMGSSAQRVWKNLEYAPGDSVARLKAVRVICEGEVSDTVDIRHSVTIEMEFFNFRENAQLLSAFSFGNDQGATLFVSPDFDEGTWGSKARPSGFYRARCTIPGNFLAEGRITVCPEVSTRHPRYEIHFIEPEIVSFMVIDKGEPGSVRADWGRGIPGVVRPALPWRVEFLGDDVEGQLAD
jgi:lipopolysaccharide transport system ATP-binding protein